MNRRKFFWSLGAAIAAPGALLGPKADLTFEQKRRAMAQQFMKGAHIARIRPSEVRVDYTPEIEVEMDFAAETRRNPHITDKAHRDYLGMLKRLRPEDRARLTDGDWRGR